MLVNIKKLDPKAVIPTYAKPGDAGMDVTAVSVEITEDYVEYDTGLAFEVPSGHFMAIFPRSSNSKKDLLLANSVGILDSQYRGPLKLRFKLLRDESDKIYSVGDRVGQIMILPYSIIGFNEVDTLSETERGAGGFGSTN